LPAARTPRAARATFRTRAGLAAGAAVLVAAGCLAASPAEAAIAVRRPGDRPPVVAAIPLGWFNLVSPVCVLRGPKAGRYARVCSHLLTRGVSDLKSYCAMRGLYSNKITTAPDVRVRVEACNLWVNFDGVRASDEVVGQGFAETSTPGSYFINCPGRWETHMGYSIRWPDNSVTSGSLLAPVTAC
jgi:hypothetical protein